VVPGWDMVLAEATLDSDAGVACDVVIFSSLSLF
jgi:hypothetical protein